MKSYHGIDDRAARHDLAELVRRFREPLRRFMMRRVDGEAEAADAVQDVFLKLARLEDTSHIQEPEKYIFRIAVNVLRDRERRARTKRMASTDPAFHDLNVSSAFAPDRLLASRQMMALIEAALGSLPVRTRHIFSLRALEDMRSEEVAKLLGISRRAVEKHYAAALSHLTRRLAAYADAF